MANPVETVRGVIAAGMARGEIPARNPDLATAMVMAPPLVSQHVAQERGAA